MICQMLPASVGFSYAAAPIDCAKRFAPVLYHNQPITERLPGREQGVHFLHESLSKQFKYGITHEIFEMNPYKQVISPPAVGVSLNFNRAFAAHEVGYCRMNCFFNRLTFEVTFTLLRHREV